MWYYIYRPLLSLEGNVTHSLEGFFKRIFITLSSLLALEGRGLG